MLKLRYPSSLTYHHIFKKAHDVSLQNRINRINFKNSSVYVNHRNTKENNDKAPFDFTPENYKVVEGIMVIFIF